MIGFFTTKTPRKFLRVFVFDSGPICVNLRLSQDQVRIGLDLALLLDMIVTEYAPYAFLCSSYRQRW
jgi:hypothetical protein